MPPIVKSCVPGPEVHAVGPRVACAPEDDVPEIELARGVGGRDHQVHDSRAVAQHDRAVRGDHDVREVHRARQRQRAVAAVAVAVAADVVVTPALECRGADVVVVHVHRGPVRRVGGKRRGVAALHRADPRGKVRQRAQVHGT